MDCTHDKNAIGIDEVGRGCIAGPVVAAAIMIDPKILDDIAVKDSKKLSAKQRENLASKLLASATTWGVGIVGVKTIDSINILQATLRAMQIAHKQCWVAPSFAWVDGRDAPKIPIPAKAVIGGDNCMKIIAAAGIIAKVYRDSLMHVFDAQYPRYHLGRHKGYGTKLHLDALMQHGVTAIHRKSYKPVQQALRKHDSPEEACL